MTTGHNEIVTSQLPHHASELTDRQAREIEYHRNRAHQYAHIVDCGVRMDVANSPQRRPWNAYWSLYDRLRAWNVRGKRVLVPGCGFGNDALILALMGAEVSAFDLSPETASIARSRAERHGVALDIRVMPAERLQYPAGYFDAVVFVDILHHLDLCAALAETRRVLRPGGVIFADELYTHSRMQAVRESAPVDRVLHPLMRRWIYGNEVYITADERKISEIDLAVVLQHLSATDVAWFDVVIGRLVPNRWTWAARADRALLRAAGVGARLLAGRVVFRGTLRDSTAYKFH